MTDTTVKYFDSSMSGAPYMSGESGQLLAVLDACLVNGFGSVTLDSLVIASNVATGTVSAGHNFAMVGTAGPVISIEGATPSGLNGQWRIASVPGSTTFTFATSGISDQTATGTITAERAAAGWAKTYTGTNKAAYSRTALAASAMLLRVDDSPELFPTLIMYETMSDVDTGTGLAPTSGSVYFAKSNTISSTQRLWALYGDDRAFYLFSKANGTSWTGAMMFGDIKPYKSSDAYACLLIGHSSASQTSHLYLIEGTSSGAYLSRSYTQTGAAVTANRYGHRKQDGVGTGGMVGINPVDNSMDLWPIECWESASWARGLMPGFYSPVHSMSFEHGYVTSVGEKNVAIQSTYSSVCQCAIDITGPWR